MSIKTELAERRDRLVNAIALNERVFINTGDPQARRRIRRLQKELDGLSPRYEVKAYDESRRWETGIRLG